MPDTNDEEDKIFIGCMTLQMGRWNPGNIVPGCVTMQCCDCKAEIHVSPSSQKLIAQKPEVSVICIPCLQKNAIAEKAKGEEVAFMGVVPGAIEEMMEGIRKRKEQKP